MFGLILHLPYTGLHLPMAVKKRLNLSEAELNQAHYKLSDPYLIDLTAKANTLSGLELPICLYPYSPLVADPLADELNDEGLFKKARLFNKRDLGWSEAEREFVVGKTYSPHQENLTEMVHEVLKNNSQALVLTITSFNYKPWPEDDDQTSPRPQISIGSSAELTPRGLVDFSGHWFKMLRFWVELNAPRIGGAFLPLKLRGHKKVAALGLSLNQRLYLNPVSGRPNDDYLGLARVLSFFFKKLTDF